MAEKSAPIPVTDLDVMYAGVPMSTLTLFPGDAWVLRDNGDIEVTFREKVQEQIIIRSRHIVWYATRHRLVVPVEKEA